MLWLLLAALSQLYSKVQLRLSRTCASVRLITMQLTQLSQTNLAFSLEILTANSTIISTLTCVPHTALAIHSTKQSGPNYPNHSGIRSEGQETQSLETTYHFTGYQVTRIILWLLFQTVHCHFKPILNCQPVLNRMFKLLLLTVKQPLRFYLTSKITMFAVEFVTPQYFTTQSLSIKDFQNKPAFWTSLQNSKTHYFT